MSLHHVNHLPTRITLALLRVICRIRLMTFVIAAAAWAIAMPSFAVPVIQITSPTDQASVNPTGGPPDLVTVTYTVTGNTCPGVKSSFSVAPYVNGTLVSCSGDCGCDGTTDVCNGFVGTITLDGSSFSSCLNTIELRFNPTPFCPTLCFTPCSNLPPSNAVEVWQSKIKDCTPPKDCNRSTVGKPVDVASGNMYYERADLRIRGPLPIDFTRRYDSQSTFSGPMGFGWQHPYLVRLESPTANQIVFVDRNGRRVYFPKKFDGTWDENRIDHLVLTQPGSPAWRVTDKFQNKWDFDSSKRLTQFTDRIGNTTTLTYTGPNLTGIADAFGRSLSLTPDANNRIQTVSGGGRTVTYTYDALTGNLTRADYSDGNFITYEYTDADPHKLTAVRDASSPTPHVIESHSYYGDGRVHVTQSDAGNYGYTLVYDSLTQTTVTNSLGVNTVYTVDDFKGVVTQSTGPGCASCGAGGTTTTLTYDEFLNVKSITDGRGVVTQLPSYDAKGNVLTRIEAFGTGRQRMTTFTYDPTFGLPATITTPSAGTSLCLAAHPNKIVTNTYRTTPAPNGDLMQQKIEGCQGPNTADFFTNITAFDYDSHGQLTSVNGPRTVVPDDVTAYTYYSDGDSDSNRRARRSAVVNALSQQIGFDGYDLFGNVGSVTEQNNPASVVTTYLYDDKDRATEIRLHGATSLEDVVTEYHYDTIGNLDFVKLPNCADLGAGCAFSFDYVYDTVNRLKEIHDALGNKIIYTFDTEGNRIREEFQDPSAVIRKFTNFKFDSFNRPQYKYFNATVPEGGGSVFFKYTYFNDGTRQSEQDPVGHVTNYDYDELKRLKTVTQTVTPDILTTTYGYDAQDNLASVIDPNTLQTTYTHSDLGLRLTAVSPDTGTTTYGYDPAGNLISTTTANDTAHGTSSSRAYDSLNRLLTVSYSDTSLNVTRSYDSPSASFGVGRKTSMTDPSGTTNYSYDRQGRLVSEQKSTGGSTFTTQYAYDKNNNRTQVSYPTINSIERQGLVSFQYDRTDRVSLVTASVNGSTATVADMFTYSPFGPRTQLRFQMSGLVDTRTYGTRYQVGTWTLGSLLGYTHTFDNDLNLTGRTDDIDPDPAKDRVYGYDEIHRLKSASGPWGTGVACGGVTYTYDKSGNRMCVGEGAPAANYSYTPSTNRLASTNDGVNMVSFGYDSDGNITGDSLHTFAYDQADRLATIDPGPTPTATYTYDGDGRRAKKTFSGTTTYFFYDPSGRLLTETTGMPGTGKDYVYLEDSPLARVDWTVSELDLANSPLRVNKNSPNVRLDWTLQPAGSNIYIVRRKQVVNPNDKSFNGSTIIATPADPVRTLDDAVLTDGNRYDYSVFLRSVSENLYSYHTDPLGTPIAMTDASATVRWRAEYLPFGGLQSLSATVPSNLRLPGQYFDGETGLHQNWFRTYRPPLGRYVEPDPFLGPSWLEPTPYAYVNNRPTVLSDPFGLFAVQGSCDCNAGYGGQITRGVATACSYLRNPRCSSFLEKAPPFNSGSLLPCLRKRCEDKTPITCNKDPYCGAFLFGTILIGAGEGGCPKDKGLGYGPTVFHEAIHSCGMSAEPYESGPLSKLFNAYMRVCARYNEQDGVPVP